MGSAQVSGEKSGLTCINTNGCTHFTWNAFNGRTMKKSSSIQKSNAIFNGNYNMVCGILPASQSTTIKPGNLVWSDEFDYSGAPDPTKWTVVNAGGGFGNNEAQFYKPENVNVAGCYFTMQARKQSWGGHQDTSGKLTTKTQFTYGIFEMRAKMPQGFWLLNPNNWPLNGEIDIMGKSIFFEKHLIFSKNILNSYFLKENVGFNVDQIYGTIHNQVSGGPGVGGKTYFRHDKHISYVQGRLEFGKDYILCRR
jgi:beta-glucanase (GH16 family)